MTSPGVEHTSAEPNAGHERQVSKDTQATLNGGGANAAAKDERRTRKRAASDGSDAVDDAHGAKRFRATAETPAGPTAAATAAQMTGSPTAAAPLNVSSFTTVAPTAVDPNHDATSDEPDEVQDDDDDEVVEAAPAQGRCRCTTAANYNDDDVVPPTCVWTTLEPAAIAYGIIPNFVDDNQTPWRLTVIPLPRGARRTEQRVNPWLPSCQWVRLGPAHLRYETEPDWVDDDGGAWCLLLIPPPRRFAPSTAAGEDEASDDEWPEQVPFVAPQAGQEEECDCCGYSETSSSEPSDAQEEVLAEDDDEWFGEDDDESDDDEPMPPMPTVDQDAKDAEADLLMEKMKARVQNAIDDGEGSKWNNGHRLELVEGYLADDENTDEEDVEDDDGDQEDCDDDADDEDKCEDEDECEEEDELEYVEEDELEYVDDEELEYAD